MSVLCTLKLEGMRFHAFHGSLEVERELGQVLEVSLCVSYDVPLADLGKPDSVYAYAEIYETVQKVVMGTKYETMEGLTFAIAKKLLDDYAETEMVEASVKRGQLYVPGVLSSSEVTLMVTREDLLEG